MGVQRVCHIQVIFVTAVPAKRFPVGNSLQITRINLMPDEHLLLFGAEISANDTDYADIRKKARRN